MTRSQFLKTEEMRQVRKQINSCGITCYVLAAVSLIAYLVLYGTLNLLDPIVLIVLGLLVQLLQSRVAAICLMLYAVANLIYMTISLGKPTGWWICVVGVYAIIYTIKFHKAWKEFKDSPEAELYE